MIQLILASPFWEDPAAALIEGEDREEVARICVEALLAADYDVRVREGEELLTWEEYLEERDA